MPSYVIEGLKPTGSEDPDKFASDFKRALRDTAKELKGSVKKIRVIDDSVQFTVESTSVAEKVIEAIRSLLRVEVKPAVPPMNAFAKKYGLTQSE